MGRLALDGKYDFYWIMYILKVREDEQMDIHQDKRKTLENNIKENLLFIVVVIFSSIYFIFQLYLWFTTPER